MYWEDGHFLLDLVILKLFQDLISYLVNISIPIRRNFSEGGPIYRKQKIVLENM